MKKRLSNIELLRIMSMLMIITLHLLSFSGLLETYKNFSFTSLLVWGLESLCFVAVNCYVLISGYFLIDSSFKFKKLFKIWIEVFFYSVIIYLSLLFTKTITFGYASLLKSFFPILLGNYWFISVYTILYILSPFLNKLVHALNKSQYLYLIILIFLIFSVWNTFIPAIDTINYGGSYSISWFICLYIIAGYLKRFPFRKNIRNWLYLFIYLLCSIINVFAYFLIKKLNITFLRPDFLYNYYSITVLIAAVNLFLFFKGLNNVSNSSIQKLIAFFATSTFGIYLIHENPYVRPILWNFFKFLNNQSFINILLAVITIPMTLFVFFMLLDKFRVFIFYITQKIFSNKKKSFHFKSLNMLEEKLCQK